MAKWLSTLLLPLLFGCTGTTSYYHLSSGESWDQYRSGCAGPLNSYETRLDDGAKMHLYLNKKNSSTDLSFMFLIARGKTVKLSNNTIKIRENTSKEERTIPIKEFISERDLGIYTLNANPSFREYQVERLVLGPTEVLNGLGRFSHNYRGESPDDRYQAFLTLADKPLEEMVIEFPPIIVNGQTQSLGPLHFEYKSSSYFRACFQ
ncbi:MAG: hypothetical protein V4568_01440 [Pseudomonadota bacterium]